MLAAGKYLGTSQFREPKVKVDSIPSHQSDTHLQTICNLGIIFNTLLAFLFRHMTSTTV